METEKKAERRDAEFAEKRKARGWHESQRYIEEYR
jgi:hypothetical protein